MGLPRLITAIRGNACDTSRCAATCSGSVPEAALSSALFKIRATCLVLKEAALSCAEQDKFD